MYLFSQLFVIIKTGVTSLLKDIDGKPRPKTPLVVIWVIVPLLLCFVIAVFHIKLHQSIDTLLTVLSIFTALIFGVLFTVPDKLNLRIDKYKGRNDVGVKNYLIRFANFTQSFVQQVSFIILLSLKIIVLLIILKVSYNIPVTKDINIVHLIISDICSVLFYYLFFYILILLSNIYILLMDDIKISRKDIA
jgi:hypothetical protein